MERDMKPEVKALFVAALRSNKYVQSPGALRRVVKCEGREDFVGYCAWGVLNDISNLGVWERSYAREVYKVSDFTLIPPHRSERYFNVSAWESYVQYHAPDLVDVSPFTLNPASLNEFVRAKYAACIIGEACGRPHSAVGVWAGLQEYTQGYELEHEGKSRTLLTLSDIGVPFTVLADLIEDQW